MSSIENAQELHLNLEVKLMAQAHLQISLFFPLHERQTQGEMPVIWDADCFIYPSPSEGNLWKQTFTDLP